MECCRQLEVVSVCVKSFLMTWQPSAEPQNRLYLGELRQDKQHETLEDQQQGLKHREQRTCCRRWWSSPGTT